MLLSEGCTIAAFDPAAMARSEQVLSVSASLRYATDAYDAASDADALLILTDWPEFAELDLKRLNQSLRYPIVIDGRNLYDPLVLTEQGFTYLSVGRPAAYPVRDLASTSTR
jgi:UDPglucose 6-dehydrogenase